MTVLDQGYSRFAREHYVGRLFRRPEHVEALLKAAAIPATKVDKTFWGVSPLPFEGERSRRPNAAYRRHCARRGVRP